MTRRSRRNDDSASVRYLLHVTLLPNILHSAYRSFSHDVTAAMLVYQNKGMAAMLAGNWTLFLLFLRTNMSAGHVSENDLLDFEDFRYLVRGTRQPYSRAVQVSVSWWRKNKTGTGFLSVLLVRCQSVKQWPNVFKSVKLHLPFIFTKRSFWNKFSLQSYSSNILQWCCQWQAWPWLWCNSAAHQEI